MTNHTWYETLAGEPLCAACGCFGWEHEATLACAGSKRGKDKNDLHREFTGDDPANDSLWW
jgi:hypothetical protein